MNEKTKKLTFNISVVIVLLPALGWVCSRFTHWGNVEFTDNVQARQHIVPVNCRVQGFTRKTYFTEHRTVHKDDTPALIEDAEFHFRLAQVGADYQDALSGKTVMASSIHTIQSSISVSDASIQEAKTRMDNAGREYKRYQNLLERDVVTRQQYDAVKTNFEASKARYELLPRQKKSAALVKQEQTERLEQTEVDIKPAEAALEIAKLNLSYTVITAPCDGTTGRKEIQEGVLVQFGRTLVNLVDESDKWVVANYKETQITHIGEGYPVDIEVDAIPRVVFRGAVKSISQATGASFSPLPQDNSAGNFMKVEQRIPVRIEFSDGNKPKDMKRLRAGMNVECVVNY